MKNIDKYIEELKTETKKALHLTEEDVNYITEELVMNYFFNEEFADPKESDLKRLKEITGSIPKNAFSVAWGNSLIFSRTSVRYRSGTRQGNYGCGDNPKIWQRKSGDGFQKLGTCAGGRDEYALVRDATNPC
jgi:hypothetical protein